MRRRQVLRALLLCWLLASLAVSPTTVAQDATPVSPPVTGIASPAPSGEAPMSASWFRATALEDHGELWIGRLDGGARRVLVSDASLAGSGPWRGTVLAVESSRSGSRVSRVDVETGRVSLITTLQRPVVAALDPDAQRWYWAPVEDGRVRGLWTARMDGEGRHRLATGWEGSPMTMMTSLDGRYVAVSSLRDTGTFDTGWDYHVFDSRTGEMHAFIGVDARSLVGVFGDELAALSPGSGEMHTPIVLFDIETGHRRAVGGIGGTFTAVLGDGQDSWLLHDGPVGEDYGLWALRAGEDDWRLILTRDQPYTDLDAPRMVRPTQWSAVDAGAWVVVLPSGIPFAQPGAAGIGSSDVAGQLVSLIDGTSVALSPQTVLLPSTSPDGAG